MREARDGGNDLEDDSNTTRPSDGCSSPYGEAASPLSDLCSQRAPHSMKLSRGSNERWGSTGRVSSQRRHPRRSCQDWARGVRAPRATSFPRCTISESGRTPMRSADTFEAHWRREGTERSDSLGLRHDEVVTLASIIEGEGTVGGDLSTISSVYHNRLNRGIRLQVDPTVVYALGEWTPLLFAYLRGTPSSDSADKGGGQGVRPSRNCGRTPKLVVTLRR